MVGVAVNVTDVPEQIAPAGLATILTAGATGDVTAIVIPVLVPVTGLAHVAFDVRTQVTICPFVNELELNVALFVPAFTPFTFH